MENSRNSKSEPFYYASSNNERSSANDDATTFEESGWTTYFEDFFANNNINEEENASSLPSENHHESSSLISDATSLIVKNTNVDEQLVRHKNSERTLSFKKRRTKAAGLIDDALEDTASSPVNSPKVYDLMNQFNNKSAKRTDKMGKKKWVKPASAGRRKK